MRNHNRHLIHWVLIAMLAILPYRSVMAMYSGCDMNDEASQAMQDHSLHMMADMPVYSDQSHDCCDDRNMACTSDCGAGMNLSFVIQKPALFTANYHSVLVASASNNVLVRAPTPPIRPPAYLQS